jgi:hypothetical protein
VSVLLQQVGQVLLLAALALGLPLVLALGLLLALEWESVLVLVLALVPGLVLAQRSVLALVSESESE